MKNKVMRIALSAASVSALVLSGSLNSYAGSFPILPEKIFEVNRMAMPLNSDIRFGIPEFKSLIGEDSDDISEFSPFARYGSVYDTNVGDLFPESFDMRDEGTISSVKDQGIYGTCWTFSAAASAETSILDTVPWVDISEWHTAYYPYTGGNQIDLGAVTNEEILKYGGSASVVANLWAQWMGPVEEYKMPYGDLDVIEKESYSQKYRNDADYHLKNAYLFDYDSKKDNRDEVNALIKKFVSDGHAIDVSFASSGYSYETNSSYSEIPARKASHSVVITGWDDNYTASNFNGNIGAWLCRNSWDVHFGDNGYFWISYDDTSLCEFAVFELDDKENYKSNYQHDSFVPTQTMSAYSDDNTNEPSFMANVFTAEKTQQIEAVSTYIYNPETEYEITVYTDLDDPSDPTSGTPSSATLGKSELTGYVTIELDENVKVNAGEKFAVSVKMYCEETPFVLPLESCMILTNRETGENTSLGSYTDYDGICEYTAENESFYSDDGVKWTDVTSENFKYTEEEKNELVEQVISENDDLTEEEIDKFRSQFENCDLTVVMGNMALKVFANPVNTVDFSHISGNIKLNETVALSVKNDVPIYYSINDGAEILYTDPINVTENMKISATIDHINYSSRNYAPAKAEFTDLGYFTSSKYMGYNDILYADRIDTDTYNIDLAGAENKIKLFAVSSADVYFNGEKIEKDVFMDEIELSYGMNNVQFKLKQENCLDNIVTVNIYRNPVDIDLETETVKFSELTLTAPDGTVFQSGDSVSEYAGQIFKAEIDGNEIDIQIPERAELPELELDYLNETLNFIPNETAEFTEYAVCSDPDDNDFIPAEQRFIDGQDITSGMIMNKAIRVIPGESLTLRVAPGNGLFGSFEKSYEIPTVKDPPDELPEYYSKDGKMVLKYSNILEYGVFTRKITESEADELAKKFGYDKESYISLMQKRYGTEDHDELLELLGAEWDTVFEIDPPRNRIVKIAVRYYSNDNEFASQVNLAELKYVAKGDFNLDGVVDSDDASYVLEYYAKSSVGTRPEITLEKFKAGDYNEDNVIDSDDASYILAYYAEQATKK